MTKTLLDIAHGFLAAYADHDVDRMTAMCAGDAVVDYLPLGEAGRGSVQATAVPLWRGFIATFADFRPDVQSSWEDADRRTAFIATVNRGTHRKDFQGIKAAGTEIAVPHLFVIALGEDDLIVKITAYWDNDTFYRQIGRPPASM